MKQLRADCVAHNPTTWALHDGTEEQLGTVFAYTERRPNGSWSWGIMGEMYPRGNEPSRDTAIDAMAAAVKTLLAIPD